MLRVQRTIKYQRDARPEWARAKAQQPGWEQLFSCIQCGTCSGTCPLAIYMDYTPRRIIALVREGFRTEALSSQTIWLCASCYACAADCPKEIAITDIMYSLKREALHEGLYPRRFPIPVLARAFFDTVRDRGRNSEMAVILRLALRSNPLVLLPMIRTAWDLLRTGRMSFRRERIRRVGELQRALNGDRKVA